jgi:glycerophosphoryl diester phosphodiesterase
MIDNPPEFLQNWSKDVGAKLEDGLREAPSFIAFARENGTVYHTYTVTAPDPFVAPYHSFLLRRTPKADADGMDIRRKDEYPD